MNKRHLAALLCLSLLVSLVSALPLAPARAAGDTVIDLIVSRALVYQTGGNFRHQDGRIVADNQHSGDEALVSGIFMRPGQHVRLELTAVIQAGAAIGVFVAEREPITPFQTGWICLNADLNRGTSRLLAYGGGNAAVEIGDGKASLPLPPEVKPGTPFTLAMEILPDGTMHTSCNGTEYAQGNIRFAGYEGGYPGIMTCYAQAEFLSATLTLVGTPPPEKGKFAAVEGTHLIISGDLGRKRSDGAVFEALDTGRLSARNKALGTVVDYGAQRVYPGEHIFLSATAVVQEGRAFGILLQEGKGPDALGPGSINLSVDVARKSCSLSAYPSAADAAIGGVQAELKDDALAPGQTVQLELEILPDGTLLARCNGREFTQGAVRCWQGYSGGVPGIMTSGSDTEFVSVTLTRAYDAVPQT